MEKETQKLCKWETYRFDSRTGRSIVQRPDGTELTPDRSRQYPGAAPGGFGWGYIGDAPERLAFAILLDITDDPGFAERHSDEFVNEFLVALPSHACLSADGIRQWIREQQFEDRGVVKSGA
ncbi:MAG: DUF6166 domain-containing protein [Candidatus Latescibacterota bacterium]